LGQIFSVIVGMDLIKKPVTAVIGGTKKIFQGAYEVYTGYLSRIIFLVDKLFFCRD